MHRVEVSAPDIAGADESNLPAPESFRSRVAYFESASGQKKRPQRGRAGAVWALEIVPEWGETGTVLMWVRDPLSPLNCP